MQFINKMGSIEFDSNDSNNDRPNKNVVYYELNKPIKNPGYLINKLPEIPRLRSASIEYPTFFKDDYFNYI